MIIAVWGNSGSGKSTLAVKLAGALANNKNNVVLVDSDYNAPQVNVWYPKLDMKLEDSLSRLLDNVVTTETIASKIQVINKRLGVLGYSKDFSSASMPKRSDTPNDLLTYASEISDIIVVDCQSSPINDILTFAAVSRADVIVISITPDIKALSWYDSNVRMFEEEWKNAERKVIRVFNKINDTAPIDGIEAVVGTVAYCLPYNIDIAEEVYTGELGSDRYKKYTKTYAQTIQSLADELCEDKIGK